ncbi:MAG: SDR family oxidoreductase [Kofleriaceae bacterium]
MPTVLITGTSTGFGRAIAERFDKAGWNVAASMRDPAKSPFPKTWFTPALDVTDRASITRAVAETRERFGTIDVLVNNAGYSLMGIFEELPAAGIHDEFAVNVFGPMDVTRAVLPIMRAQEGGAIVNVTSGSGLYAVPMLSAYHASKFAIEGWSESLSFELGAIGIRVKCVEPGACLTTSFAPRAIAEAGGTTPIADYGVFRSQMNAMFSRQGQVKLATPADIAETAFVAATDRSPRLRYPVGPDIEPFITARQTFGEERYRAFMLETFGQSPGKA